MMGDKGREVETVFQLMEDIGDVDSTGPVGCLDVLRCDNDVLVIEMDGRIMELRRATAASSRLLPASRAEVQSTVADGIREDQPSISAEDIRHCAYRKWESAGRPSGDGARFWLEAEQELVHELQATV
jgi:hypothetical protein